MNIFKILSISFFCLLITSLYAQKNKKGLQEVDFVNSYIGTAWDRGGGMLPMVSPPYAMTNFTAQTRENIISQMPYIYEDSTIIGFIATHQPMLWMGDYGYVSIMPVAGELKVLPKDYKLKYRHEDEVASPYYYRVKMNNAKGQQFGAEMAASSRCGIFNLDFPEGEAAHIVVQALNISDERNPEWLHWIPDLNSKNARLENVEAYIRIDKERNEITGYNPDHASFRISPEMPNFKGYFVIQFDSPINDFGTWNNDQIHSTSKELYGKKRMGAYATFNLGKKKTVKVKVATSFISEEQARENLKKEIPGWDLQTVAQQTKNQWQDVLQRIKINGVSDTEKHIFYTALYHCMLYPREIGEYGRYYSPFDDRIHYGTEYTDFSLWDTFRALHPLLLFIQPERVDEIITSMLQIYQEGGRLPMWPNPAETNIMIGSHADAVIADAFVKGFRNYDVNLAYEAMRKNAMVPPIHDTFKKYYDREDWKDVGSEARAGLTYYHSIGYIPCDKTEESVSRTLEYALDDYCVAQVAKELGKTDDYDRMMNWSKNYKNIYNRETGFMTPRFYDGSWNPRHWEGFTEGSPWTYRFCAMQDIPGMIDLMGGKDAFIQKLDDNFNGNHYVHENEPGHHYMYLYDYCGQPWKTQELIRRYTRSNYQNLPNGIFGNDDCGQMSAWYIFSVMGFYPVTPASGIYAIGAPQFPELTLNYTTPKGEPRVLHIIAKNISDANKYVKQVSLDGKILDKPFISHKELLEGKDLVFEMSDTPNYNWK